MISCKEYAQIQKVKYKESPNKKDFTIIQVGDNPASNSYIKGKINDCKEIGIEVTLIKLNEDISQEDFENKVYQVSKNSSALIIQLPLPAHLNEKKIQDFIEPSQDVDGMFYNIYPSCTPEGIIDWLEFNQINLDGANIVVIGRSELVGKPLAKMLIEKNATVSLCHSHTKPAKLYHLVSCADIIISAVGLSERFTWYVPYGKKIFIDVGITKGADGKLHGDFNKDFLERQGHYVTPVPGGVGLLTRVTLLKHLVK